MPEQSLGRGLESLIPPKDFSRAESEPPHLAASEYQGETAETNLGQDFDFQPRTYYTEPQREEAVYFIEIEKIKPNPQQPRREFNEAKLAELADSIREHGILQPLIVTKVETEVPNGTQVEYQLIAGERRWLAAQMAGLPQVPVIIRPHPDEAEKLELALIENIQREDLNVMERARAFERLIASFGYLQKDVAQRMGKSRESVSNVLRLLNLPLEIQKGLEDFKISEGHARVILTMVNSEKQRALYYAILRDNLSVRESQELAENLGTRKNRRLTHRSVDPDIKVLEDRLEEILGTKVDVNQKGDKGKIQIAYYSKDNLLEIMNRILTAGQEQENLSAENTENLGFVDGQPPDDPASRPEYFENV